MIKLILSIFESIVLEILEINLSTIDLPAIFSIGLGTVNVCGLNLEPHPAMGTIILIYNKVYLVDSLFS